MKKSKKAIDKKKKSGFPVLLGVGGVLFVGLAVLIVLSNTADQAEAAGKEYMNQNVQIEVESFPSEGREHTEGPVAYKTFPPTSGNHSAVPADYGFYETASPPFEQLVHSLEHGDVVIYYKTSLPEDEKQQLRELAAIRYRGSGVIAVPNDEIDYPLVLTAWTKMMHLEAFDAVRMKQFMYQSLYEGPEKLDMPRG
jgi:hypothetical protein